MMKKRHARRKLEKKNLNKCGIEKEVEERNYDQNNSFYDESKKKN